MGIYGLELANAREIGHQIYLQELRLLNAPGVQ